MTTTLTTIASSSDDVVTLGWSQDGNAANWSGDTIPRHVNHSFDQVIPTAPWNLILLRPSQSSVGPGRGTYDCIWDDENWNIMAWRLNTPEPYRLVALPKGHLFYDVGVTYLSDGTLTAQLATVPRQSLVEDNSNYG